MKAIVAFAFASALGLLVFSPRSADAKPKGAVFVETSSLADRFKADLDEEMPETIADRIDDADLSARIEMEKLSGDAAGAVFLSVRKVKTGVVVIARRMDLKDGLLRAIRLSVLLVREAAESFEEEPPPSPEPKISDSETPAFARSVESQAPDLSIELGAGISLTEWVEPAIVPQLALEAAVRARWRIFYAALFGQVLGGQICCVRRSDTVEAHAHENAILGALGVEVFRVSLLSADIFAGGGIGFLSGDAAGRSFVGPGTTSAFDAKRAIGVLGLRFAYSIGDRFDVALEIGGRLTSPRQRIALPSLSPGAPGTPLDTGILTPFLGVGVSARVF